MARSSLVALLQSWTRDIQREQSLERGETPTLRRREVLTGAAAVAGAAALGAPAFGQAATARIGIVGAGLAGLTAAYRLKQKGYNPVVIEGDTRIGGRCYTIRNTFKNGQIGEHGGEFIDTGHHAIRSLAAELGLQLDDVHAATPADIREKYLFNGEPYDLDAATKDYQYLYPIVQKQNELIGTYNYMHSTKAARFFDAMTADQWIRNYVPDGLDSSLGQLFDDAFSEENGADTSAQSALNIISAIAPDPKDKFNLYYTASDQRFHVRGGNDQIPALLAQRLGGGVLTGMDLIAIRALEDKRIRLTLKRATATVDEVFDRVILTLPFVVLALHVDYSGAGFRVEKARAIHRLGMGDNVKSQFQFERRLWDAQGCSGEIRLRSGLFQTSWEVTRAQPGTTGVMNFFSGGSQAWAAGNLSQQDLAQRLLHEAEAVLPGLSSLWNGVASIDVWRKNRWALGSYSFYPPGYQTTTAGVEKVPEGNCFFAGEHTWSENGYLNAGVASGERAANEVIRSLTGG